jgi:hypothetical protein
MLALAKLVEKHEQDFLYSGKLDADQFLAFRSIQICRTKENDGDLYQCDHCAGFRYLYHSCGHRFCPKCQNHKTTEWLYRQKQKMLPCDYFMITFTVPQELRRLSRKLLKAFYNALYSASSEAIKELCQSKLKGEPGMLGVLHTNSRTQAFHPHIHYIVPGVVLNKKDSTLKKITTKFFLHHDALAKLFRGKLLAKMKELGLSFPRYLYGKKFIVDCAQKGDGRGVFKYLSKYLVRGTVSEKALFADKGKVRLRYQDSETKLMRNIHFDELTFLKRLAFHVLPKGFRRVREYGFLAPAGKKMLARIQLLLQVKLPDEAPPEKPIVRCPCCQGKMSLFIANMSHDWYEQHIPAFERTSHPPPLERTG